MIESEYFFAVVSMTDFLDWDESENCCGANQYLKKVVESLNVQLDLVRLHDFYFDNILVGRGDVHLYKESPDAESFIAVDLFKEPTDQLDLVSISVRCNTSRLKDIRLNMRSFFDSASCKVLLEETNISPRIIEKIDPENYPRIFDVSNYRQKLRTYFTGN